MVFNFFSYSLSFNKGIYSLTSLKTRLSPHLHVTGIICGSLLIFCSQTSADMGMSGMITNQITRTVNDGIAKNLFDNLIIPQLKIKNSSGIVLDMQLSPKQRFLSFLLEDGSARIWDLNVGVQRPIIKMKNGNIRAISANSQHNVLYAANNTSIDTFDSLTAQAISSFPITLPDVKAIATINPDNLSFVISHGNELTAWDAKSKKPLWNSLVSEGSVQKMNIAAEHQLLATLIRTPTLFSSSDQLEIRDLSTGIVSKILEHKGLMVISFQFTQAETLESIYENGDIVRWNSTTGEQLSLVNRGHSIIATSKINNGIAAYAIDEDNISIINQDKKILSHITKPGVGTQSIQLLADGKKLITTDSDGKAILWDSNTGKEILQIISTRQGWSLVDKLGRFDSSEKAMPNISWEADSKEIPLDSFSKKYYEPGLLATALNDESYINTMPAAIEKGISLPPKLELVVKEIKTRQGITELQVEVTGQGGGIDSIDLYHNTKVISGTRAILDEKSSVKGNRAYKSLKMQVTPTNGINSVKVIASNKMGIQGQSQEIRFKIEKTVAKPVMRVITIGVNQYKDAQLNLDYSVPDAQSIAKLLNQNDFSKFSRIEKKQLYNSSATKLAIMSELINLSQGAKNDVLAIYFAGHGISVNGEWYFLPYETILQPDMKYFASVGISASELSSIFVDSNIQQILLMVDACYSGASVDSFRRLQNSQRHFSRDISKSVGITVVTATRKDQEAAELTELGHGLFTYVLSKGMSGEADWWPKNNEISAHELAKFSTDTIPLFSKKFLGSAQEPTAFTMGRDFSLLSIKK